VTGGIGSTTACWVLLVSLLCAPYAWVTDEAVLLPAVLVGVYRAIDARRSLFADCGVWSSRTDRALYRRENHVVVLHVDCTAWLAWYLYAIRKEGCAQGDSKE